MKDYVYLEDLYLSLSTSHLKLKLDFLNKLLINSSKSNFPHKEEMFCKMISSPINKTKRSSLTIYGWMKGYRTIPFSKLFKIVEMSDYSWRDIEKNLISIKAGIRKGEINPNFPIKIDYKLGSIVGHILGDGSIDKRFHSVFYSNSNKELLKEFLEYMENIFGIKPRIWVQDVPNYGKTKWLKKVTNFNEIPEGHNVGLFYPKICADFLYSICDKFAEGGNKEITNKIKELNLNFKNSLVRAFFDDEGSVNSRNYTVRFHQDRKDILEDLIDILKEFNIKSNPVRSYNKRDKLRYYFNITGFVEYSQFYELIGCTSSKKKSEFILLINKVKNNKKRD
jgi:hypothetical protein